MGPNTIHSKIFKSAPSPNPKNIFWQGWIITKFQIGKGLSSLSILQVFTTHTLNMPWHSNLQLCSYCTYTSPVLLCWRPAWLPLKGNAQVKLNSEIRCLTFYHSTVVLDMSWSHIKYDSEVCHTLEYLTYSIRLICLARPQYPSPLTFICILYQNDLCYYLSPTQLFQFRVANLVN